MLHAVSVLGGVKANKRFSRTGRSDVTSESSTKQTNNSMCKIFSGSVEKFERIVLVFFLMGRFPAQQGYDWTAAQLYCNPSNKGLV